MVQNNRIGSLIAGFQMMARGKDSTATDLVRLAESVTLFSDERDAAYGQVPVGGHLETWRVSSRRFAVWLARRYWEKVNRAPGNGSLTDALTVLEGKARYGGRQYPLSNRFAWAGDRDGRALFIDLADPEWRAVRIDASGWRVVEAPAPLFRRYAHQQAQVQPDRGGSLEMLDPFLNASDDATRLLLKVALVVGLNPDIPRTVLLIHGPQGSAKSTTSRLIRQLLDPSAVPLPSFPSSDAEMAQLLDHHAVVPFDNVSSLSRHRSDALCRAVTGDGFTKRRLYTDDDDVLYSFRRLISLNGIAIPATAPDLLDRSLLIRLERLTAPREERQFWEHFEKARPFIIGAMYDAFAEAMAVLPGIRLVRLSRMADWTRWGYAAAEAIGSTGDRFLDAYDENRARQNAEALESHPVGAAVLALMEGRSEWKGTPSELLGELNSISEQERIVDPKRPPREWPKSASWVTRRILEVEPNLRADGIEFTSTRDKLRTITLSRVAGDQPVSADDTVDTVNIADLGLLFGDDDVTRSDGDTHLPSTFQHLPFAAADGIDGNDGIGGMPLTVSDQP
jgi:hypothetical protein